MLNNLQDYIDQFIIVSSHSRMTATEKYARVMENLAEIVNTLEPLYQRDPQTGNYTTPFTEETKDNLLSHYGNLQNSLNEFRTELAAANMGDFANALNGLMQIAQTDRHTLDNLVISGSVNLPDAIENGRSLRINVPDYDKNILGNVQSARHPVTFTDPSGKVRTGFFTEDSSVDYNNGSHAMLAMYGAADGASIPDRNVGMSRVADLIGISDNLAPSSKMQVVADGVLKSGIFMDTASGTDLTRMTREEAQALKDVDFSEQALRQIADIQIVDMLCQNTDRHGKNLLYQFKKDENGKVIVDGVKGIDHDCSFGTADFTNDSINNGLVGVNRLKYCSESAANRIMALDKNSVQLALKDLRLSDDEKNAVWNRALRLQERLSKGEIRIVKDGEWKTIDKEELFARQTCFDKVREAFNNTCKNAMDPAVPFPDGAKSSIPYAKADLSGTELDMKKTFEDLAASLKTTEGFFKGESDKYTGMKRALESAQKTCDAYLKSGSEESRKAYENSLKELGKNVDTYISYKKEHLGSKNDRKRYDIASKLKVALKQNSQKKDISTILKTPVSSEGAVLTSYNELAEVSGSANSLRRQSAPSKTKEKSRDSRVL